MAAQVVLVEGDISQPDLGLSPGNAERLSEVSVVLHCAAKITLFDPIHTLLAANYVATRHLMDFAAARMPALAAFVHTSSTYATFDHPAGSTVKERVRPLWLGDLQVDDSQLASSLLSMDPASADVEAGCLVRRWGLRTPYVLTKRLAELAVQRYHDAGVLPCAIVRPSGIFGVAGDPRPGYISNFAIYSSLVVAYASGFNSKDSFAWHPDCVEDTVPADVAAGLVLGAAAALAAGVRSRRQLQQAAEAATAAASTTTDAVIAVRAVAGPAASSDDGVVGGVVGGVVEGGAERRGTCSASDSSPGRGGGGGDEGGKGRSGGGSGGDNNREHGHSGSRGDGSGGGGDGDCGDGMLVFHAATSGVRPMTMLFFYDRLHRIFSAHKLDRPWPLPAVTKRSLVHMDMLYEPHPRRLGAAKRRALRDVALRCGLLKLMGRQADARRLATSLRSWWILNSERTDPNLIFSVRNALQLEALLAASGARPAELPAGAAPPAEGSTVRNAPQPAALLAASVAQATERPAAQPEPQPALEVGGPATKAGPRPAAQKAAKPAAPTSLVPVVWRGDWGPLIDAFVAEVVTGLMRAKLVPRKAPQRL